MAEILPTIISKGDDGCYHPSCEDQIVNLVKYAYAKSMQLRVRGSGHSIPKAIYTDVCESEKVDVSFTPPKENINVKLDNYCKVLEFPKANDDPPKVTAQAGIRIGEQDRNDKNSTVENSLGYQLHKIGYSISDMGGISRQTISGFLCTGSSGSSIKYDLGHHVYALRIIDGTGDIYTVSRDDENPDHFNAALVSLGVLGVVSTVTLTCDKSFYIHGAQRCDCLEESYVDIFNDDPSSGPPAASTATASTGDEKKRIGLTTFLKEAHYGRILWWPQRFKYTSSSDVGVDQSYVKPRLQIWQATRCEVEPLKPKPFKLFPSTELQILYSYLMTLQGNLTDLKKVSELMREKDERFTTLMVEELQEDYEMREKFAKELTGVIKMINELFATVINGIIAQIHDPKVLEMLGPAFSALSVQLLFAPLDKYLPMLQPIKFHDYGWHGVSMDRTVDDVLTPTMFTELWVPLIYATKATKALEEHFSQKGSTYKNTGNSAWEIYSSDKSNGWMSMSYSNGKDDWREGVVRIDPYWFVANEGSSRVLYQPIWELFLKKGIPYRLHWGKVLPAMDDKTKDWQKLLVADNYPRFKDFLAFREEKDPHNIFLNSYWKHWLGIDK